VASILASKPTGGGVVPSATTEEGEVVTGMLDGLFVVQPANVSRKVSRIEASKMERLFMATSLTDFILIQECLIINNFHQQKVTKSCQNRHNLSAQCSFSTYCTSRNTILLHSLI
jgi:hypothetical protein